MFTIRRPSRWADLDELQATGKRSLDVGDNEMPDDIRWIRSYIVREADGTLGTVCIYEASTVEKIREHAERVDMPATEIREVVDVVLIRPDPVRLAA
jgi:thiamine biosynthesis protein ThiC